MGLALRKTESYTSEEYLDLERASEIRHEHLDGVIYEMAVESLAHSRICINIAGEMRRLLKGKDCEALSPNMKVRAGTPGLFAYPDLTIVCGTPEFHDERRDVLLNPKVIVEVLSPSTWKYDQIKKFYLYRKELQSLTDYILIYQDVHLVEHYEKVDGGRWIMNIIEGLNSTLQIPSIECEIAMLEIYDRVEITEVDTNFEDQ